MSTISKKPFIDVEQLFREKNPKLAKRIPRFIFNWLRRTIHEQKINAFMAENGHLDGISFCKKIVADWSIDMEIRGEENLPKNGGVILAANHPLGGFDAIAFVAGLSHVRNDITFIVNDLLLYIEPLRSIFTGVNKHGANARESLTQVDALFGTDKAVFLFPAGLVSRKNHGLVRDLAWKKAFITRAVKYRKPIIPIHIEGELTPFFYRLSRWRKRLGIKANIEMLFLADEMVKQHHKKIRITIGKPIDYAVFDKSKSQEAWAQWVKDEVYKLGNSR